MQPCRAIRTRLREEQHRKKIDSLGESLTEVGSRIDFAAQAVGEGPGCLA